MMLREALELIQQTACKAQKIQPLGPTADGRMERFDVDGVIEEHDVPPPNRKHEVYALADLIDYAQSIPKPYAQSIGKPVVWYAARRVELVLDDTDRRDRVVFELTLSPQFMLLEALAEAAPFTQRGLLNFLRLELDVPAETVALFRRVDWTDTKRSGSEVQHTKESLGAEIMAECQGVDGLPEELKVEIPVYREFGEREAWPVRLAVEIDVAGQRFYVQPVPGELDTAVQNAQMSIGERLHAALKGTPVYYGSP